LISESARARVDQMIQATIAAGARLLTGAAARPGPGWFYEPTVLLADTPEPEAVLAGVFGPVVLIRGVPTVDAAVEAANASPFGLAGSVWGRDVWAAHVVARRLEAGMVAVNEAVTPSAHAAAPFGGIKASGFGRTRGEIGIREFTQPQTLHLCRPARYRPQHFPYGEQLERLLAIYRWVFHPRS
jgi:acyl-CoA reductase-like NAD-dependent aldehyde dehydrogenase